ncbi:MAG TPA: hypothetical protein VHJ20_19500 [Polyangia bacterium]|nr:hypothetical protein [Polyangia bacterium]
MTKLASRLRLVTLVAAVLAHAAGGCATSGSGSAAHVPRTGLKAADYYPLAEGWKWAYDLEKDGQKILAVYAVVDALPDRATIMTGEEKLDYAISPDGIAQLETIGAGDFILKNPIAKDATWTVAGGSAKIVSTTDEITTDAGHFYDCAVVEVTRVDPKRVVRTTFAPDVGPVAIEVQVEDAGKMIVTTRAKLRSITRPGEDPFGMPKPKAP